MFIVYITTNLVNQKYYIGIHKKGKRTSTYLGSGQALKFAIRKYGKENFKRKIIFENVDESTAKMIEALLVNSERLKDPFCYNMTEGGGYPPSRSGIAKSESWKLMISEAQKKSWADGKRIQHKQSEEFKLNMRLNNPSKDPAVKEKQRLARRAHLALLTPEERSDRAKRGAETKLKNKLQGMK